MTYSGFRHLSLRELFFGLTHLWSIGHSWKLKTWLHFLIWKKNCKSPTMFELLLLFLGARCPSGRMREPEVPLFWNQAGGHYLCREYPKAIAHKVAYPIQTYWLDLRLRICRVITFRMVFAPFLGEPSLVGSAKSGQAALKMATRVGDLSHHLLSSKKRSFASSPPHINCCPIPAGGAGKHLL